MANKTKTHRKHQRRAAGRHGQIEVPIDGLLDVRTRKKAVEIERTGKTERIEKALQRLANTRKPHKILKVPDRHVAKACRITRTRRQKVTVSNLSGTRYCYPSSRQKP